MKEKLQIGDRVWVDGHYSGVIIDIDLDPNRSVLTRVLYHVKHDEGTLLGRSAWVAQRRLSKINNSLDYFSEKV